MLTEGDQIRVAGQGGRGKKAAPEAAAREGPGGSEDSGKAAGKRQRSASASGAGSTK
jgi:hypothetical protein